MQLLHNVSKKVQQYERQAQNESFLFCISLYWEWTFPADIYLFKNNTENIRGMYEKCSKLTIKISERRYCCCSGAFIVNFEQISNIVLMLPLLTLNKEQFTLVNIYRSLHCVKSVQIRSFFWSVFSCIQTEYGPEKTPYLDTFRAVLAANGDN